MDPPELTILKITYLASKSSISKISKKGIVNIFELPQILSQELIQVIRHSKNLHDKEYVSAEYSDPANKGFKITTEGLSKFEKLRQNEQLNLHELINIYRQISL